MKKAISLILVLFSLVSMIIPVSAESGKGSALTDEEYGLLEALSLIDDGGYSEGEFLTRAEFCNMVCKLFKYEETTSSEMTFRDVDATHPYYGSISALYEHKLITGVNKYVMGPNKNITLNEALSITLSALGFGEVIELSNTTYYAKAKELGITDKVLVGADSYLDEESAIRLMYNVLFTPMIKYRQGMDSFKYIVSDDVLMMEEVYDLYEKKGIITENGITTLYGESTIKENEIRLNNDIYLNGNEELSQLLGYAVKGYVKMDDNTDEGTLIYAYKDASKTEDIKIVSQDIVYVNESHVAYETNEKVKKAKLASLIDVIYNGIGIKEFDETILKPSYGEIKLIDNNDDGLYDVALVTEYQLTVVNSISNDGKVINIVRNNGSVFEINQQKTNCIITVRMGSEIVDFNRITSGSALLIADSGEREHTRRIEIILSSDTVKGTVKSVSEEDITIGSDKYDLCPLIDIDAVKNTFAKSVNGYIDIYGNVIHVKKDSGELNYGFLFKGYYLDDEDMFSLKILNTDNEWNTYYLDEKVYSNGDKLKAELLYKQLLITNSAGKEVVKKQLVRYELNEDGIITRLDLAQWKVGADGNIDMNYDDYLRENDYFRKSRGYAKRTYNHDASAKGLFISNTYDTWVECYFTSDLAVLVHPDSQDISENEVHFYNRSYFIMTYQYFTEIYDINEENATPLIEIFGDAAAKVSGGARYVAVDKICDELNEDGEAIQRLYGWQAGRYVDFEGKNENAFTYQGKKLQKGDMVRVAIDFNNKVESIEKNGTNEILRFRVDNNPEKYFTDYNSTGTINSSAYQYNQTVIGRVSRIYGNYVRVEVKNNQYIHTMFESSSTCLVYDADEAGNPWRKGSKADIALGDVIFIQLRTGKVQDVFVFKM